MEGRRPHTVYCDKQCRSIYARMMDHRAEKGFEHRALFEAHLELAGLAAIDEGDIGALISINRELRLTRRTKLAEEQSDAPADSLAQFDAL